MSAPRLEEPIPLDFAIWLVNASPTFTWHWKHLARIRYYLANVDRGEIDRLAITCPPRHGKACSNDTPVLTPNGFVNHGDLRLGDKVYGSDHATTVIVAISEEVEVDRRVWFYSGDFIDCHDRHEWTIKGAKRGEFKTLETRHLVGKEWIRPRRDPEHFAPHQIQWVSKTHPKPGRCIQVDAEDGLYLVGRNFILTHNSELVTIRRPAHRLELDPSRRFIVGAHSANLAKKFSRRTRGIIRQRKRIKLNHELQQAENWETLAGGGLMAAGVSTGIAGHGANEVIIDDPVKSRAEANSMAYRDACWEWYTDDLYTRLEPDGSIILIMTRWHEDDLMGRILDSADAGTWTLCHLPAIAEHDDELGRAVDAALCPERYDEDRLARIKQVMGASFNALYQGRPSAQEGNIILSAWFRYYDYPERVYRQKVQSWDTANKDRQLNDWNVCLTWGVHAANYDLLDEYRKHLTYPKLKRAVIEQAEKHHPDAILIEDRGNGTAVIQDLRATTLLPIVPIEPEGEKVMRLSNESGAYESGIVRHPKHKIAHWIAPFEAELVTIPSSTHDDRGDSTSQFLKWAKRHAARMSYDVLPAEDSTARYETDASTGYGIVRAPNYYD